MPKVKIIERTKEDGSNRDIHDNSTLKVAAYCRVSTANEEQATSYENQIDEWTKRITRQPNWELVKIYADDGISGTSEKHRDSFSEMVEDAKLGKIDRIYCKSISRFARNTLLTLKTVADLKSIGVGIYFDNEGLDTLDPKSDAMLAFLSMMAQEESRHISENVSWTFRKKMSEGIPFVNCKRFLGYDKNETKDRLVINPEEAEIVRLIFDLYDSGEGCLKICRILQERGIKTVAGGDRWHTSTITGILRNEKYIGNLLLQKTYTVDFLGHIRKNNTGQREQYYIEGAHDPIITKEQFYRVQEKLKVNSAKQMGPNTDRAKYNYRYPLSGSLICLKCGNTYKRRTWNSGQPCQKVAYQCNSYINHGPHGEWCYSQPLSEKLTHQICCDIINDVYLGDSKIFARIATLIKATLSADKLVVDESAKLKQKDKLAIELNKLMKDRLETTSIEVGEQINKQIKELIVRYERVGTALANIKEREQSMLNSQQRLKAMLGMLSKKKIKPEMLTKEMIQAFFYRILIVGSDELVFVIDATHSMPIDELIKQRHEVITRDAIYEGALSGSDPKPITIKYKVVLV